MVTSRSQIHRGPLAALGRLDWRAGLFSAAVLAASALAAHAQTKLNTLVGPKGYIQVQALTCAQFNDAPPEDAGLLGVWYSGWLNGKSKNHFINVDRTKAGIQQVTAYCQANPDKKVVDAVKMVVNQAKSGQ